MLNGEYALPFYADLLGLPLQNGKVYFGVPGQNPVTNPVTVYWDSGATQPAAQPIGVANGRTVRSDGTPARVWVSGDFSKLVQDVSGRTVLFETNQPQPPTVQQAVTDRFSGTGAPATYTLSVTPADANSLDVYVAGVYQQKNSYTLAGNHLTINATVGVGNVEAVTRNTLNYTNVSQSINAALSSVAFLYPGTFSTSPGARPDGSPIQPGDRYNNSSDGYEYIFIGGGWTSAANQAQAAAASAAQAGIYAGAPGATVAALIGSETSAIAIHAYENDAYGMKVVDATNPANNRVGSISSFIAAAFPAPKMVMDTDAVSLKWSPHNYAKQTDNLGANASGGTPLAGQLDSDGTTGACKLTATSVPLSGFLQVSVGGTSSAGQYLTKEWIVRAGTSTWAYLAYNEGSYVHAWFDLTNIAVGTVDAGILSANIYTTRNNGTALPTGYFRLVIVYKPVGAHNIVCGQCDANGSKNVTVGRTFFAEKPFLHLGMRTADFFPNTGTTLSVGVPYDYSKGSARIRVEPAVVYNGLWSDDMTNAAWAKSASMGATLTATGPHNQPCSTLTASAADQTCLQSIVSAATSQVFTPYVKRRTGTGSIWLTADNGATWTDITSQLSTTRYTRFAVNGTTNPTVGFKISISGDAIDVALANNGASALRSSPYPTFGAAFTRTNDALTIPVSLLSAATNWSFYVDFERAVGNKAAAGNVRIGRSDFTQEMKVDVDSATNDTLLWVNDGTTPKQYKTWLIASGERLEITAKVEANKHVMSINGEPPAWLTTAGMPTVQQMQIGLAEPIFLRKLLLVPRAIDKDDVRTWRYSAGPRNNALASVAVAYDSDTTFPNSKGNRVPSMLVLSDDGENADVLVFWSQIHDTGFTTETPARVMQRKYRFTKSTGQIQALTAAAVVYQQAGWVSGTGNAGGVATFFIPSGTNAGRIVALITLLENPNFTPDKRSIYVMYNDAGGDPAGWTVPVKVVNAASGSYALLDPSSSTLILPADHPVAPNRLIALYLTPGGSSKSLYSDNWGITWTQGTTFTPAISTDEPDLSIRPDGTLVATYRVTAAPVTRRTWATSVDGGVTWVDQGVLPAYSYSDASAGLMQMDPTGATGVYGKIAISHPASAVNRFGVQIDFATDAAMTFGNSIVPWATNRYFGYSSIKALFGGSHIALAVEGGAVPFNNDNNIFLALIQSR